MEWRSVQLSDLMMIIIFPMMIIRSKFHLAMLLISLLLPGQFNCQICDKSFRTPTFLLQHYVSPHFRNELRRLEHLSDHLQTVSDKLNIIGDRPLPKFSPFPATLKWLASNLCWLFPHPQWVQRCPRLKEMLPLQCNLWPRRQVDDAPRSDT